MIAGVAGGPKGISFTAAVSREGGEQEKGEEREEVLQLSGKSPRDILERWRRREVESKRLAPKEVTSWVAS